MSLKNRYSESNNTFDKIQKILATHGARKISYDYGEDGRIYGITFELELNGNFFAIKLPARLENVSMVMFKGLFSRITNSQRDQVYRTAWANVRDWIDAQMAMLDTKMVVIEEIFLPYLYSADQDQTFFEHIKENPQLLLMKKN